MIAVIGVVIGVPLSGISGLVFGPLLLSFLVLLTRGDGNSVLAAGRLERIKTISEEESL